MISGGDFSQQERKLFFSLLSGDIYVIDADETKNLDAYQVPLKHRPSNNCNRCFGRGHVGFNTVNQQYVICKKCMRKCIDFDAARISDEQLNEKMKEVERRNATTLDLTKFGIK
jgi:hypothetical protein